MSSVFVGTLPIGQERHCVYAVDDVYCQEACLLNPYVATFMVSSSAEVSALTVLKLGMYASDLCPLGDDTLSATRPSKDTKYFSFTSNQSFVSVGDKMLTLDAPFMHL